MTMETFNNKATREDNRIENSAGGRAQWVAVLRATPAELLLAPLVAHPRPMVGHSARSIIPPRCCLVPYFVVERAMSKEPPFMPPFAKLSANVLVLNEAFVTFARRNIAILISQRARARANNNTWKNSWKLPRINWAGHLRSFVAFIATF